MDKINEVYQINCDLVLNECKTALQAIDPKQLDEYITAVLNANRVFFVGVGRVMLSLQATAKRFAHCGIDTVIVGQITEPAITKDDLLVAASGSGESLIPVMIAKKAREFGAQICMIGSNPNSTLWDLADIFVRVPTKTKLSLENEIESEQPMTSLFEQTLLLLGDIVAKIIIEERGIEMENLWRYHANLE
jgi:6-phospho-3-hexuloisomerase